MRLSVASSTTNARIARKRYWFEVVVQRPHQRVRRWRSKRLELLGPITVSKLADEIGLDQSTISQQMRPLTEKRLVLRTVDAEDRRIGHLAIAPAGRRLCERIRAVGAEGWGDILAGWTLKEREELARLLGGALTDSEPRRQRRERP